VPCLVGILLQNGYLTATADISVAEILEVGSQKRQCQSVAAELYRGGPQLGLSSFDPELSEQPCSGFRGEGFQIYLRCGLGRGIQIFDALAGGDYT